jgi:uncharacterized membrane protein YdjX (TVP38/TMEM64 family)
MTRFWILALVLSLSMLVLFFVMQALDLPFLAEDTSFMLRQEKWAAGLAGTGLLLADVVAPVPSSIIMFANGILFGPVWGTLLSTAGGVGAALLGYWIGTQSESFGKRWIGEESFSRARSFFFKYGLIAVIVSRPIPILAETVSIISGISGMPPGKFFLGAVAGVLPIAAIYAVAGACMVELKSGLYVFLAVTALAGSVWAAGRRVTH